MIPIVEVIYFVEKYPLVQNKNKNKKCPEQPHLTVPDL
jgi:hypothetical protein